MPIYPRKESASRSSREWDYDNPQYEGRVVATFREPDVWGVTEGAVVWEGGEFKRVTTYCYHDGLCDYFGRAEVDAEDHIREKWEAKEAEKEARRRAAEERRRKEREEQEKRRPARGKVARTPDGVEGEIFWVGQSKYPPYQKRVGLRGPDGEAHWHDASDVEVLVVA